MKGLFAIALLVLILAFVPNEKKRDKTPPGTVRIDDTLFMDKTEIGNVHWREFQYWLYKNDSIGYINSLHDTLVWREEIAYCEPMVEYYFRHPAYNYYPVVGVSYEQAIAFCKWRSNMVNQSYERNPSRNPFPNKKIRYRLPTKEEWEKIAMGKLDVEIYPFGVTSTTTKFRRKNVTLFNCIYNPADSLKRSKTLEVTSYLPNNYGCYNMIGNVSEMVSEKGIAKGGNFLLPLDSCKIKLEQHYTKPEAWLGFRCVCVVE